MSAHTLKLLSEAYRNVAIAPTNSSTKTDILADLETMIAKEVMELKYPAKMALPPAPRDLGEIPF